MKQSLHTIMTELEMASDTLATPDPASDVYDHGTSRSDVQLGLHLYQLLT